ncbi:MAG TPA: DUF1259 domain-containing protein [Gammaproteobacteria bacterium]|nr:DUF1259 domain-containing protein [Gammaproteobacteria bacterium]
MNWQPVEAVLGAKGSAQPGGVYKFSLPRRDLKVTLDGVVLEPGLQEFVSFLGTPAHVLPTCLLSLSGPDFDSQSFGADQVDASGRSSHKLLELIPASKSKARYLALSPWRQRP